MPLNTTKKDMIAIWRSPLIWVVLSLVSFIFAWLVWQMLDQYIGLQVSFASLPSPPNVTDKLWIPSVLILAKLMLMLVALTTAQSFAQENAQKTLWYLMINNHAFGRIVWAKFRAQGLILLFVWIQSLMVLLLLLTGGELNWVQVLLAVIGLSLFVLWFVALGMLISSCCHTTGTAVLLSVVVFVMLWMVGGDGVGQDYGINWLRLISPVHHLKWFCQGEISLSSLIYFVGGGWLFLFFTTEKLKASKRS